MTIEELAAPVIGRRAFLRSALAVAAAGATSSRAARLSAPQANARGWLLSSRPDPERRDAGRVPRRLRQFGSEDGKTAEIKSLLSRATRVIE